MFASNPVTGFSRVGRNDLMNKGLRLILLLDEAIKIPDLLEGMT